MKKVRGEIETDTQSKDEQMNRQIKLKIALGRKEQEHRMVERQSWAMRERETMCCVKIHQNL